jgi:hypothetical protein
LPYRFGDLEGQAVLEQDGVRGAHNGRYRRPSTAPAGEELTGMVNLDDTRHCPIGPECESCGRLDELAVVTGDTRPGSSA